jgi:hypothetical protein
MNTLPATAPTQPLAPATLPVQNLFPTEQELNIIKEQANIFVKSGLLPQAIKTPEQAILIMLKGREMGIPPLQAISHLHVINGKVGMGGEIMLQQIYRLVPGAQVEIVQRTDTVCEIHAARPGRKTLTAFKFTLEEARKANLLNKDVWKNYPGTMLQWRTVSMMARAIFPDAIAGCYTPEELGAQVDSSGNYVAGPEPVADKAATFKDKLGLSKRPEPVAVDSEVAAPAPQSDASKDPGEFVIPSGPLKGKKLKEIDPEQLRRADQAVRETAKKKPITGAQLEVQGRIQAYLRTIEEQAPVSEPSADGDQGAFGEFGQTQINE